jgi:hypothetical protein
LFLSGHSLLHFSTSPSILGRWLAIALMMEAAGTSETLVNFYQSTRRYNPEDSHLRTHHRKNLKSYSFHFVSDIKSIFALSVMSLFRFLNTLKLYR